MVDKISIVNVHVKGFNNPAVHRIVGLFGISEKWDPRPNTFGGTRDLGTIS